MDFRTMDEVTVTLYHGDCVEIVPAFAPQSVDAIITDIPYGTTACKWDTIIPFSDLWRIIKHVLKPRGAFVTTASQPFTSALVMSNPKWFKYEWIWDKYKGTGFQVAKYRPMIRTENILIFGDGAIVYNPQKIKLDNPKMESYASTKSGSSPIAYLHKKSRLVYDRYPTNLLQIKRDGERIHPTQKPVALYEYLIKTYSHEGDTILDICMGSGTTGIACQNTGRNFIGIEKDAAIFRTAEKRINQV